MQEPWDSLFSREGVMPRTGSHSSSAQPEHSIFLPAQLHFILTVLHTAIIHMCPRRHVHNSQTTDSLLARVSGLFQRSQLWYLHDTLTCPRPGQTPGPRHPLGYTWCAIMCIFLQLFHSLIARMSLLHRVFLLNR